MSTRWADNHPGVVWFAGVVGLVGVLTLIGFGLIPMRQYFPTTKIANVAKEMAMETLATDIEIRVGETKVLESPAGIPPESLLWESSGHVIAVVPDQERAEEYAEAWKVGPLRAGQILALNAGSALVCAVTKDRVTRSCYFVTAKSP